MIKRLPHPIYQALATLLLLIWLLPVKSGITLRWLDQFTLYAPDIQGLPLSRQMPGGLLAETGSYLSQLFYHPALGSSVIFLLWGLTVFLAWRIFSRGLPLLLSGIILLGASILTIDTDWVTTYAPGYLFVPSLGLFAVIISAWIVASVKSHIGRTVIVALLPFLYPVLGVYAFVAWSIGALFTKGKYLICALLFGGAVIILLPIIGYNIGWFPFTSFADLWFSPLPSSLHMLILPGVSVLCFIAAGSPFAKRIPAVVYCLLWLAAAVFSITASYKSEEFRAMSRLHLYLDSGEWKRMVSLGRNLNNEPSQEVAMLLNVAHMRAGIAPVSMTDKTAGEYTKATALVTVPVSVFYGRPNLSYRWAMEHTVKYGHRAYFLKFMVRAALLNGEWELADRYLSILDNTMFHREWAGRYRRFLGHPELIAADPEFAGIPSDTSSKVFF